EMRRAGFSDALIEQLTGVRPEPTVPAYKLVDTCAAEFEAATPYYYSCWEEESEAAPDGERSALVVGSGPIRIGQGIEFDYCSVHAAWALREADVSAVLANSNPETVSTDFDTSDRLYFEPLDLDAVRQVAQLEHVQGAVVQFGGQTAINLADPLGAARAPPGRGAGRQVPGRRGGRDRRHLRRRDRGDPGDHAARRARGRALGRLLCRLPGAGARGLGGEGRPRLHGAHRAPPAAAGPRQCAVRGPPRPRPRA